MSSPSIFKMVHVRGLLRSVFTMVCSSLLVWVGGPLPDTGGRTLKYVDLPLSSKRDLELFDLYHLYVRVITVLQFKCYLSRPLVRV